MNRESIREALNKAGWQKEEVQKALSAFAEVAFPLPVPRPKPYLAAREAFLYLLSFITLYISAFSFGALLFQFIDRWFPDASRVFYGQDISLSSLRMAIASLIIAFPLHLALMARLTKSAAQDPERSQSLVRKWLTYLTLVVVVGVLIGDSISLLFNVLGGETTWRFFLKSLVVFLIGSTILGFYLAGLQKEEKES
jgi:hypothetical protein